MNKNECEKFLVSFQKRLNKKWINLEMIEFYQKKIWTYGSRNISCFCNICGCVTRKPPTDILKNGCYICKNDMEREPKYSSLQDCKNNIIKWATNKIKNVDNSIEFIDVFFKNYYGNRKEFLLLCKCRIDGHEWVAAPSNVLNGKHKCSVCNETSGEKAIRSILENQNINFKYQYAFKDLRNKRKLRFDFAVLKNDNAVDFLIEYQGKQHFEPVDFFGGEEIFQYQQHNDFLKREYCKYNNIELIEINYIEFKNMDNILNKHINKGE